MSTPTIIDLFEDRVAASGNSPALRYYEDNMLKSLSWTEWLRKSSRIAATFVDFGISHGDRVAILSHTRVEWLLVDIACHMIGAIVVPIYPTQLPKQCAWILNDVQAKLVVAEDPGQVKKLTTIWEILNETTHLIWMSDKASFRSSNGDPQHLSEVDISQLCDLNLHSLREIGKSGRELLRKNPNFLSTQKSKCTADNIASIVYTSGTTGRPRGVILSQANFVAEIHACATAIHMDTSDDQLFFLPLAHILARILYMTSILAGSTLSISQGPTFLIEELKTLQPTLFAAVPSVFERLAGLATTQRFLGKSKLQKKTSKWILNLAAAYSRAVELQKPLSRMKQAQFALADRTIFKHIREMFGGRLRYAVSGGAALSLEVATFFHGTGTLILEGYGLTENCGAATFNDPKNYKLGSVGRPITDVEIKIAEDGEILLRGPSIMQGYWNDKDATKEVLIDGWLHSGDYGNLEEGYLYVTDRKKDIIITSTGKNIAPVPLESKLRGVPMVRQAIIYGDNRPFLTALITLDPQTLIACAQRHGMNDVELEGLAQNPRVRDIMQQHIDRMNQELPTEEHIRRFAILANVFDIKTGELTPSQKMRRRFITEKYRPILDGLYES